MVLLLTLLGFYLGGGLVFALWFAWRGAAGLDPVAAGGSRGFRLLVIPGAAALWPLLLRRLLRGRTAAPRRAAGTGHRRAHLLLWATVGPLLLVFVVVAWQARPEVPVQEPPPAVTEGGR